MDVDIALAEVPVNLFPLIDDTDFKSREVTIAYDQAGMDLVWNFVTTGGAFTQTAVTPTTGGNYDWTNQGDGMYTIEIPDTGGASINNDAEGFGWFTGICTGVLPWRGPIIGFRAALINDALVDGTVFGKFVNVLDPATGQIDNGTLGTSLDTYQCKVELIDDDGSGNDRYSVVFFKNGEPITSGITVPKITVIKDADGTDLIAEDDLTEVGALGHYRYTEGTDRVVSGAAYKAKITATIASATRSWFSPVGRDSTV